MILHDGDSSFVVVSTWKMPRILRRHTKRRFHDFVLTEEDTIFFHSCKAMRKIGRTMMSCVCGSVLSLLV